MLLDMKQHIGEVYGFGSIVLMALDAVISKVTSALYVFPIKWATLGRVKLKGWEPAIFSRINITKRMVCSQWVAVMLQRFGSLYTGGAAITANPDRILDHFEKHPSIFPRIS